MTEEKTEPEPRITNTQKEKDPRKVDAGKKLGAISKMAKKQKAERSETKRNGAAGEDDVQNLGNTFFYAGLAAVVVVGCLGTLYWNKQQPKPQEVSQSASEGPEAPKFRTSLTHSNLISLDD